MKPPAGAWFRSLRNAFPERQIMVRNHGRIHCFCLGTVHQILIIGVVAGAALWSLLATAAYFDGMAILASKDDEIALRTAELDGVKANYKAAFGQLDEFQSIFSGITCEIADIQDSLLKIAERNVGTGKRSASTPSLPRLNPDAGGCQIGADDSRPPVTAQAQPGRETTRIIGALKQDKLRDSPPKDAATSADQEALRRRVAQLESELTRLKASHGAFLESSAGLAAVRIDELERALSSVGVDTKTLAVDKQRKARPKDEERPGFFGKGGPFIAATGGSRLPADFSPVALFNNHADRLDNLTSAIKTLPLGQPLSDFEVTSPFGARNDPINALSGIHEGVDLGAMTGTPVMATGDGLVVQASWRDRYGMMVEIEHGMGVHTRYAHLSKVLVNVGQHVSRGTPLGLVGETGRTTGPHLHYEVRVSDQATNPMKFIMAGQNVLKGQ